MTEESSSQEVSLAYSKKFPAAVREQIEPHEAEIKEIAAKHEVGEAYFYCNVSSFLTGGNNDAPLANVLVYFRPDSGDKDEGHAQTFLSEVEAKCDLYFGGRQVFHPESERDKPSANAEKGWGK